MDFKILGRTSVRVNDGFTEEWGTPKERAVLAVLLLNVGKAVSVRSLAEWVWLPDKAPRDPTATLSTYTARIRSTLKRLGFPGRLKTEDGSYRFLADPLSIDYHAFQQALWEARRLGKDGDHARACALARSALLLWSERPLADLETDRADNWRRVATRDEWLSAHDGLLYGLHKLGEHEEMLRLVKSAQIEHDTDVLLAKRRIQALHALGRREEAVQYFLDFYRRAKDDDDPERADEVRKFHDDLLAAGDRKPEPQSGGDTVAVPRQLPYDVDGFTGRVELIGELEALVTGRPKPRLIALDGLPGVGKTALAVHWAHRVRERFPHGQCFVNLNGFGDGPSASEEDVVIRLLDALRVSADCLPTAEARRNKLRDVLSNRQLLVVLDNAADSKHVHGLLSILSGSVVVVTSRLRLSDLAVRHGARCFTVTPLESELAVGWLRDRLGARAAFEPDAVGELAAVAGGLPLALGIIGEYVAAQPGKPLADFADQLRERGVVIGLGANGSQAIFSLGDVFECSYRALNPEVRRLFRLLGLYPGLVFQREVAAALTGLTESEVHDQLEHLVWARLLEVREGNRYAFHDLLRDYAGKRVELDEDEHNRQLATVRLLDWFLHTCNNADQTIFASRLRVPMLAASDGVSPVTFRDVESAVEWCGRERAEIMAIIGFAAVRSFEQHLWRLINCAGEIMMRLGFKDEVLHGMRVAVEAANSVGDRFAEAGSLCNLGFAHARFYEYDEAEQCYVTAHRMFVEVDSQIGIATVLRNMGERRAAIGDIPGALRILENALAVARNEGSADTEAGIVHRMGEAMRLGGRLGDAIAQFHHGWSLRERIGDMGGIGASLASLATAHHEQGDHFGALSFAHRAVVMLRQAGEIALEGQASTTLAAVHRDLDDFEKAEFYADRAITLTRQARDLRRQAGAQDVLGQVRWRQGRHSEARECWSIAYGLYSDLGDSRADGIRNQLDDWSEPDVPPSRHPDDPLRGSPIRGPETLGT
ncbi:BTAD domain-containing putative transcriptional regulator [Saccharothrix sp. NRRL B-16314]|uniref:BTAD domain-containing putative transcriptional regulator n=1 Tax=Saccharothrix sp. NRRL B-16314 TaxID=1463825 RepID=UPI0012DC1E6A|nr:BTAD domain-containing putative transcriptional regulator [Saccharothrix sp. NRRL B-16314]